MSVKLFVEGGGDSKELHSRCREAFRRLLEKAGFTGRLPRIVACGGRNAAFDDFRTSHLAAVHGEYPMLLVDSEAPVLQGGAWAHLASRDQWQRPPGVGDDQAQLMVVCMESWIMADRDALKRVFGADFRLGALLPEGGLEERVKQDIYDALERATRDCGRDRRYDKGRRSFRVVCELDPAALRQHLPHFRRLIAGLDAHL